MKQLEHPWDGDEHPWGGDARSAVDLDVVDDPTASAQDRALDAQLGRLVADRLVALELPPSGVDVEAAKRRARATRARRRRRTGWVVGAVAAAAAVVVGVVGAGLLPLPRLPGLPGLPGLLGTGAHVPAAPSRGDAGPVSLRDGVPDLPADEVARLEALQPPGLLRGGKWPTPLLTGSTPVDCGRTEVDLGVRPAELDGLDTSGLRQECALLDDSGGSGRWLYHFYVPAGVGLEDLDTASATAAGVSWTVVAVDQAAAPVSADDRPDDPVGGVTTVRWGGREPALASVRRTGTATTELSWVEPWGRSGPGGVADVAVRAVVAASPVMAVRAALGFVNQSGMRLLHSDDGTFLLVPGSEARGGMDALTWGSLTRTPEGCLGLTDGAGAFRLVLWPSGTTWDPAEQSLSVPGEGVVRLGQDVRLGGGEGDGVASLGLVPEACATEKTWISATPL